MERPPCQSLRWSDLQRMSCQGNLGEAVGLGLRISSRMSCELHCAGLFYAGGIINLVDLSLAWLSCSETQFQKMSDFFNELLPLEQRSDLAFPNIALIGVRKHSPCMQAFEKQQAQTSVTVGD